MLKRHVATLFLATLLAGQTVAAQDAAPPLAPEYAAGGATGNGSPAAFPSRQPLDSPADQIGTAPLPVLDDVPAVPVVMPPAVPPRPPLLPNVSPAAQTNVPSLLAPKPPLSWRAKANMLRSSNQAPTVVMGATYDDAVMALVNSLPQYGLRVVVLNSKSGEVLATAADRPSREFYVFTLAEMPPGSVTIKGMPAFVSKSGDAQAKVRRVLDGARGTLQAATRLPQ